MKTPAIFNKAIVVSGMFSYRPHKEIAYDTANSLDGEMVTWDYSDEGDDEPYILYVEVRTRLTFAEIKYRLGNRKELKGMKLH